MLTLNDFKYANTDKYAQQLFNIYMVINELNLWHKFIEDKPNESYGLSNLEWIKQIGYHPLIEKDGHTGLTFGISMKNMEYIAQYGEDAYIEYIKNQ
jgi:hypothetical protein